LFVGAKTEYHHERNLLADVWNGPESSTLYPEFLWAFLTRPGFSNGEEESIRDHIVATWRAYHTAANEPALARLLFGEGGRYDADALDLRATLLEQVKAHVGLASQDIAALEIAMLRTMGTR